MSHLNDVLAPSRITNMGTEFKTKKKQWPNGRTTARREWDQPLHQFEVEWDGITLAEFDALRDHFVARSGGYAVFTFTDTHTDTIYNVRYADDRLMRPPVKKNVRGLYKVKVKLEEDKQ